MQAVLRDLGYAARTLRKNPAFALTAIVTLALGIGVSSAIFSVVNAVLLRPLPYDRADRLALITQDLRVRGVVDFPMPPADYVDFRTGATFFDGIAAIQTIRNSPFGPDGQIPQEIVQARATTNIFDVLKVPIVYGRNFSADDGVPNAQVQPGEGGVPIAGQAPLPPPLPTIGIISAGFWQRQFGGDSSVLGRNVMMGGQPVQIVGVVSSRAELLFPPSMNVERFPDVWTAMRVNFEAGSRQNVQFRFIGRMKEGVSITAARGQIDQISADLRERFPTRKTAGVVHRLEPMKDYLVGGVKPVILSLMGAVLFVLLIACANVANLLLVRASQRERELAVRSAMGGSPWTIVRQLLAESVLLASIAAVLGIGLAQLGIALLLKLAPPNLPRLADVSVDPMVLGFTVVASFAAAIIFGLVPALRASRPELAEVLRASGRTPSLGGAASLRNGVIIAEVALSFVLLVGSGLMIRSFVALSNTDPGFDPNGVITFGIGNFRARSQDERNAFTNRVRDRMAAIPGVTAVTAASSLPFDGQDPSGRWGTQAAMSDPRLFRQGAFITVMPGYFEAMKTRLIAGRTFTNADDTPTSGVIVIDETVAKLAFGSASAIGKTLFVRIRTEVPEPMTVIGVVKHQRHTTLSGTEKESIYYPTATTGFVGTWAVRGSGDANALADEVRAAVKSIDPLLLTNALQPMGALVDRARAPTRFALILMGIFAGIAVVLASVGLYGVLASVVRQRTSEIGIRMAVGSQSSGIFALIIGQGLKLTAIGIAIGLAVALAATRVMSGMLVGVRPTDPLTFIAMIVLFLVVATIACWLPARRAAGLDPNTALRES